MKKPKVEAKESDFVRLAKDLEARRQAKAKVQAELDRIADDLQKVTQYYQNEVAKLNAQREAVNRDMRVANVHLENAEEVGRKHGLVRDRYPTATEIMYREMMFGRSGW